MVFDSIPFAKDYTVIVVYRPVADTETTVWEMGLADSCTRGLTTERIVSDSVSVRYAEHTETTPAINTLRQSWPSRVTGSHPYNAVSDTTMVYARLSLGGNGNLDVAEVLYFTGRLNNADLRRLQSGLAVRYGITLGPVDYLDGAGHRIWEYADSGLYHHRVTGVGADILTGLHQLCSRSESGDAILTVSTDSLGNGSYLLAGDNNGPLAFEQDGNLEMLQRSWRIQATMTDETLFSLAFDTRDMANPGDSLVLLVDYGDGMGNSHIYLPNNVGGDSAVFSGVAFPTDSSRFTLGRGGGFWQMALMDSPGNAKSKGVGEGQNIARHAARLYPNPTSGHYFIEVDDADWVRVTIYNMQGAVVASHNSEGGRRHRFGGELPTGNVYYATIETENGSQTMKLAVK